MFQKFIKMPKIHLNHFLPSSFDAELNGQFVAKGTWLMTLQVHDDDVWQMIKNDEITGLSIGAMSNVEELKD